MGEPEEGCGRTTSLNCRRSTLKRFRKQIVRTGLNNLELLESMVGLAEATAVAKLVELAPPRVPIKRVPFKVVTGAPAY